MKTGTWQIALLFSASALGGTYLSGYEWLRFFSHFGSWGTIGIILTSACLTWLGYRIVVICQANGATSLQDFLGLLFGSRTSPTLTFLTYAILLAYAGTIVGQQVYHFDAGGFSWILILIPFLFSFLLVQQGIIRIMHVACVSLTAGLLFLAILFTQQLHIPIPSFSYQLNGMWLGYACFYLSLHFLLMLTIIIPLTARLPDPGSTRMGIWIGGAIFFLLTLLGHVVLLAYWHEINTSTQPLREVIVLLLPYGSYFYAFFSFVHVIVILACLFYGLTVPLVERYQLQQTPMLLVFILASMLFSYLPLWSEIYSYLIFSGATYIGMFLLVSFGRKYRS